MANLNSYNPYLLMNRSRALLVALTGCAVFAWAAGTAPRLLVASILLVLAPGYLFERLLATTAPITPFVRPALWVGLSLSLVALVYQWATAVGLALTPPLLGLLAATCSIAALWAAWRELGAADRRQQTTDSRQETGDRRPETAERRPQTADRRLQTADNRQQTVDQGQGVEPIVGPPTPNPQPATRNSQLLTPNSQLLTPNPPPSTLNFLPTPWLALVAILLLVAATRASQLDGLALPPWVDSIHHALLVRVVAERGFAPYALIPYLPITGLSYHWGYHAAAATLFNLTAASLPQTLLWFGQVLNGLHALSCAALAAYLWRRPSAGLVAAIVAGLISLMPAYYLSWGRYTQLAGLLLLPPLAIAWDAGLRRVIAEGRRTADGGQRTNIRYPLPKTIYNLQSAICNLQSALLLAGLSIIHFRSLVLALALLLTLLIVRLASQPWLVVWRCLVWASGCGGSAVVLAAPWMLQLAGSTLRDIVARPAALAGSDTITALNTGILWAGQNRLLVALALAAALWGVVRQQRNVAALLGWLALLVVLANPWLATYLLPGIGAALLTQGLGLRRWWLAGAGLPLLLVNPRLVTLPASWLITNDVVSISLFIPLSALIGLGAVGLYDWISGRVPMVDRRQETGDRRQQMPLVSCLLSLVSYLLSRVLQSRQLAATGLLAALALWGAWNLRSVVNPATVFATPADLAAVTWVQQHTPADARFLINATDWQPGVARGVDGGWWLLPLAGRWVSTPPVLFFYGSPDYVREVEARNRLVVGFTPGQADQIEALITRDKITHLYFGSVAGVLKPAQFIGNPRYQVVYQQDGVTILAVIRQP